MNYETKITAHRHGRGSRFAVTDEAGNGVCCGSIDGGAIHFDKGSAPTKAIANQLRAFAGLPVPEPKEDPKPEKKPSRKQRVQAHAMGEPALVKNYKVDEK